MPGKFFKKYNGKLDYFKKLTIIAPIKASANPLKPLVLAAFLSAPLLSAWAWNNRQNETSAPASGNPPITERLPIEIIATETQPKWVLVPIDPS
ncbi:hypothetical protein HZ994_00240 [Akkermansiaceae bacterium]|nr:hypothetical protein HZ994_00240 [Akkermansiaceae bacterium]